MIKYAIEKLYHLGCPKCGKWWSISDWTPKDICCPHWGYWSDTQLIDSDNDKYIPSFVDKFISAINNKIPSNWELGYGHDNELNLMKKNKVILTLTQEFIEDAYVEAEKVILETIRDDNYCPVSTL